MKLTAFISLALVGAFTLVGSAPAPGTADITIVVQLDDGAPAVHAALTSEGVHKRKCLYWYRNWPPTCARYCDEVASPPPEICDSAHMMGDTRYLATATGSTQLKRTAKKTEDNMQKQEEGKKGGKITKKMYYRLRGALDVPNGPISRNV
ncbi:hypothetical protein FB451DRAFT_1366280 [Mycena latifolia]|nr:hypothetical protein FB451DRAFT_1366280 [Mycena latifolia]